jgi:hypothetical protein
MLELPTEIYWKTGRTFNLRFKEHIQAIRSNCSKSGYTNHTLNMGHTYVTITDTMDVIRTGRKSRHLNTLEKYDILPTLILLIEYVLIQKVFLNLLTNTFCL